MSKTLKMAGGDILMDSTGRPVEIVGLEKVTQDVAETLLNEYDSGDPPWYPTGAEFHRLVGSPSTYSAGDISTQIETMVYDAIERVIISQEEDPYVDDDEMIYDIVTLRAFPVGDLSWAFYVSLLTESEEQVKSEATLDLSQQLPQSLSPDGDHITGIGVPL